MSTFSQNVPTEPKILHLFVDQFNTLLSNNTNVINFLNFSHTNCFNFLSLYDLQSMSITSTGLNSLSNFIYSAKTNYGVCDVSGSVDLFEVISNGLDRPTLINNYNQLVGSSNRKITWFTIENEWWRLNTVSQTTYNTCTTSAGSDVIVLNGVNAGLSPLIVSNIILVTNTGEYRQIKEILGGGTSIRVDRPITNSVSNSSFTVFNSLGSAYQLDFETYLYRLKLLRTYTNQNNIKIEAYLPREGTDSQYFAMAPFLDRILLEEENSNSYTTYNEFTIPSSVNRRTRQILTASTAVRSGTIVINGINIQGTGTNFTNDLAVGTEITVGGQKFTIASINGTQATTTLPASPNITSPSQFRTYVHIAPIFYINHAAGSTWINSPSNTKTYIDLYKFHTLSNYSVGATVQVGVTPKAYQDEYGAGITESTFVDGVSIFSRTYAQGANGSGVKVPTNPCSTCGSPGTIFTLNTPTSTNATCDNAMNGTITVSFNPTNLTSPFIYNFIGPTNTVQLTSSNNSLTFSGCVSGSWSVSVQDSGGLISNTVSNIVITETFLPTIASNTSGTASITIVGGLAPYYVIETTTGLFNSPTTDGTYTYTGFTPGNTYTFTVGDNDSCWESLTATITSGGASSLPITVTSTNPTCNNALNGTINIILNAVGTPPYTYYINNGTNNYVFNSTQSSYTFGGAISGTWNSFVTDSSSPTQLTSSTITSTLVSTFDASISSIGFGTVCFRLSGGTLPYYIHDTNNTFFQTVNTHGTHCFNIVCGVYAFTVGDSYGCSTLLSPTTISCAGITLTLLSNQDTQCNGICTGRLQVAANSGTFPYTYSATNGTTLYVNTTGIFSGLCSGSWTLSSKDSTGSNSNVITPTISNTFHATAYTLNSQICVYSDGSSSGGYNLIMGGQSYTYTGSNTTCYTPPSCGYINIFLSDSTNITGNTTYHKLLSFNTYPDIGFVEGDLLEMTNGLLYGMSDLGGTSTYPGRGTIFSYNPITNTKTVHYNFGLLSDGMFPLGGFIKHTNGLLYGTTNLGGIIGLGTIFSYNATTNIKNIVHHFSGSTYSDGSLPRGNLMRGVNGKLYGTTMNGGIHNQGTIFSYDPATNIYNNLHSFSGYTYYDGEQPMAGLVQVTNTKLYGTTIYGGQYNEGTIFSFDITLNTKNTEWSFGSTSTNGRLPWCQLLYATDGLLYGTTTDGGNGYGLIYNYNTATHLLTNLYTFSGTTDGRIPHSLMQVNNGLMYGLLERGGSYDAGTIFVYDSINNIGLSIYNFSSTTTDGIYPRSTLIQTTDSKLYGTTLFGGTYGSTTVGGTIFNLGVGTTGTCSYATTVFVDCTFDIFVNPTPITCDGLTNGSIYVSAIGGTPNYTYTATNGTNTYVSTPNPTTFNLLGGGLWTIYGKDSLGNVASETVDLSTSLEYYVTLSQLTLTSSTICFTASGGTLPYFIYIDNVEYTGLTANTTYCYEILCGGITKFDLKDVNHCPTISYLLLPVPCKTRLSLLVSVTNPLCDDDGIITLNGSGGSETYISYSAYNNTTTYISSNTPAIFTGLTSGIWNLVVTDSDGNIATQVVDLIPTLFDPQVSGAWSLGPAISVTISSSTYAPYYITVEGDTYTYNLNTTPNIISLTGCGLTDVVVVSSPTVYSLLQNLDSTTTWPVAYFIPISNSLLYGTTIQGNSFGTIFSYNITANTFNSVYDFITSFEGTEPEGSLLLDNNLVYGTTKNTQGNPFGTIFSYEISSSTYTTLHTFLGAPDGEAPKSTLIKLNNNLYGTTNLGGLYNYGSLFKYEISSSTLTIIHNYTAETGTYPSDTIIEINNKIYGTTYGGGNYGDGTIFSYEISSSTYSVLHSFSGDPYDGSNPLGPLTNLNNHLYGTTYQGGSTNPGNGIIFEYNLTSNTYNKLYEFQGAPYGRNPTSALIQSNSGLLYGTLLYGDANNFGLIYNFNLSTNNFDIVHTFSGATVDGEYPYSSLYLHANNGILYGLTKLGGTNSVGTIYKLETSNCEYNTTVDVPCTEPLSIVSEGKIDPTCGDNNGSINLSALGGDSPYYWEITNGIYTYTGNTTNPSNIISFTGLTSSIWTATVTDISGATATNATYLGTLTITLGISSPDSFCLEISNGTPTYTVLLDGLPIATYNITPIYDECFSANCGTHTLSVIDNLGCDFIQIFELTCLPLGLSYNYFPPFCNSISSLIQLIATGGTGHYIYSVTNGLITNTATTGDFYVSYGNWIGSVTDSAGNTIITPSIPMFPLFYGLITPISNGVITTFSGSEQTYVIIDGVSNGPYNDGTQTFGLSCGVEHTVKILGQYNLDTIPPDECFVEETIFITCGPLGFVSISYTDPSCYNTADGTITITVSGGTIPYTYSVIDQLHGVGQVVTTNNTSHTFTNIGAGPWDIMVEDVNGNTIYQSIIIDSSFYANVTPTVNGYTVFVTGGTAPYNVYLNGNPVSINTLNAGTYTFNAACGLNQTVLITTPFGPNLCPYTFNIDIPCTPPTLVVSYTNPSCGDNANGTIIASASGGLAPYTYTITDGINPPITNNTGIFNLVPNGTWIVTVTDSSPSPTPVSSTIILTGSFFMITSSTINNLCVVINGGLPPYNVYLDGILKLSSTTQTTHCFTASCGTDHIIMVTDATPPCTVFVNEQMVTDTDFSTCVDWTISSESNVNPVSGFTCGNGSLRFTAETMVGIATIVASQVYNNYPINPISITYAWQFTLGDGDYPLSQPPASQYAYPAFYDGYGNGAQLGPIFTTSANTSYSGLVTFNSVNGFGTPVNTITFKPSISLLSLPTFNEYLHISAQLVSYTLACPCIISGATYVPCSPSLGLTLLSYTNPGCDNVCDGTISVSGYNGTSPYVYSATNGTTTYINSGGIFTGLCQSTWYLSVQDSNNSIISLTTGVTLNDTFFAYITSYGNGYCVTISGGTTPYFVTNNGVLMSWNYSNITNCYPPISGCGITSVIRVKDSS